MLCCQRRALFPIVLCLLLFYKKDDVFAEFVRSPSTPMSVVVGEEVTLEWTTSLSIFDLTWGIKKPNQDKIEVPLIYVRGSNSNVQFQSVGAGKAGERYKGRINFTGDLANKEAAFKIIKVQPSDAVEYGLKVSENGKLSAIFGSVKLQVIVPATVTQPQVRSHYTLGEKINITCQATGTPLPTVKWIRKKDNKEYPSSIGVTHLVFNSIGKEDDGKYNCMASNSGGNAQVIVNITVYYKPDITQPAKPRSTKKVYENGKNDLVCIADGNPSPTFTWKKDGFTITEGITTNDTGDGISSTLALPPGSKESTGNLYVCTANNSLGSDTVTIELEFGGTEPPTTATTPGGGEPGGSGKRSSDSALIGGAVGGSLALILIVVIIIIIIKCRKGRRGSRGYQGRGGYKERGTKSVSDIDDYEPVTKNNELPQYATVDRSKKTPKKSDLNYAELDHQNQSERSVDARPAKRNNEPTTYAEIVQTWEPTNERTYANVPRRGLNSSEML